MLSYRIVCADLQCAHKSQKNFVKTQIQIQLVGDKAWGYAFLGNLQSDVSVAYCEDHVLCRKHVDIQTTGSDFIQKRGKKWAFSFAKKMISKVCLSLFFVLLLFYFDPGEIIMSLKNA